MVKRKTRRTGSVSGRTFGAVLCALAVGTVLCGRLAGAGELETVEFVWKARDYDVPGSATAGLPHTQVAYSVTRGQGTVILAHQGTPPTRATLVLAANPTRSAQIAAAEFNHYVEKMTGLRLPVVTDESRPFEGAKVLVGESQLTRALGLRNSDFAEQEYLIRTYGDLLVLMGCDEPEYGVIDYEGNGLWPGFEWYYDWSLKPDVARRLGSVYAVDTFLERFCGVRWYMPGDLGEVCPQQEALVATDLDLRRKPWSLFRAIYPPYAREPFHFLGSGRQRVPINLRDWHLWLLRMKLLGREAFNANHSLIAEWFQQRFPNEQALLAKGYEHPTQLCLTSPRLREIVTQDADDYFTGRTNYERSYGDYFCVMPHDTGQYCTCPDCQATIKGEEDTKRLGFWSDRTSNYVWGLVNEVAQSVQEKHPGKWVSCCSYADYALVPDRVQLADNVAVEVCRVLVDGLKDPAYREFYRQEIADWARTVKRWYMWEYFDHLQGNYQGTNFPGLFLHEIADDLRFLQEHGGRGLFNELSSDEAGYLPNLAQDHLNLYVQLKLLDDLSLDVDELLDEYCRLFYGPASAPMKQFFVKLEERFTAPDHWKLEGEETDANWDRICPPAQLKEFEELLSQAVQLAEEEPYSTRVRLIREAIYGPMAKNCLRHFVFMKTAPRRLVAPLVQDGSDLQRAGNNHVATFYSIGGDPVDSRTEAWVGYDPAHLYVRVQCYEEFMDKLTAVFQPDDEDKLLINTDDSVELFIDVGRTRKDYYQILGNTNGALNDQKHFGGRSDFDFSTEASCQVEKAPDHWTITFTVPLDRLTDGRPVQKGEVWGFNICRNRDPASKGLRESERYTAWCPTGLGFHVPERFGVLEFQ